jgi:hypothetical protein
VQSTVVGIELTHMLNKGQWVPEVGALQLTPAQQFYSLSA